MRYYTTFPAVMHFYYYSSDYETPDKSKVSYAPFIIITIFLSLEVYNSTQLSLCTNLGTNISKNLPENAD